MKIYFTFFIIVISTLNVFAENIDSTYYANKNLISNNFNVFDTLQFTIIEGKTDTITFNDLEILSSNVNPLLLNSLESPGKLSSFWFTFVFAAVGTYTIYGAGAGVVAFGIVYLTSKGDKIESRKSIFGLITGTLVGAGIRLIMLNI